MASFSASPLSWSNLTFYLSFQIKALCLNFTQIQVNLRLFVIESGMDISGLDKAKV